MIRTAIAAVVVSAGAAVAAPVAFEVGSDADLNSLINGELFVAEGRAGNNAGNGDWELGITTPAPYTVHDQAQRAWSAGEQVQFSLSYDNASGDIVYVFGGQELTWNTGGDVGNIYIRARATRGEVSLSSLNLDGTDLAGNVFASSNDPGLDILGISGAGSSFTLTGLAAIDPGTDGRGSNPAFQIKVDSATVIPTPTAAVMGLFGLGAVAARRRR